MWSDPGNRAGDQNGEQALLERAQPPSSTFSSSDWIDQETAATKDEVVRARAPVPREQPSAEQPSAEQPVVDAPLLHGVQPSDQEGHHADKSLRGGLLRRHPFAVALGLVLFSPVAATGSALSFVLMIPWELTRRNPVIDFRIVATRQFGSAFLLMLATGAILLATTNYLPQLVQQEYGYTATWAGLVLSPGGLVTALMMPVVGILSTKVQPRTLIAFGAAMTAFAMDDMTRITGDTNFWFFAVSRIYLGIGLPLLFLPVMAASYAGVPANKTDLASAVINAARNTGGSIGISLANNILFRREQFHQSRLVELVNTSTSQYRDTLNQVTNYFVAQGASLAHAQQQAFAWVGQQVQTQAAYLAYIDVFWALTLISAVAIPLALSLRKVKLGGPAPVH